MTNLSVSSSFSYKTASSAILHHSFYFAKKRSLCSLQQLFYNSMATKDDTTVIDVTDEVNPIAAFMNMSESMKKLSEKLDSLVNNGRTSTSPMKRRRETTPAK
uniref:Uncharacterized protein n=1 Tax=Amphimedon queenslandica TaxID=400682 RepID=A0A1X7USB4_AMPQE